MVAEEVLQLSDAMSTAAAKAELAWAMSLIAVIEDALFIADGAPSLRAWLAFRYRLSAREAATVARRVEALHQGLEDDLDLTVFTDPASRLGLGDLDVLASLGEPLATGIALALATSGPDDLRHTILEERKRRAAEERDSTEGSDELEAAKRAAAHDRRSLKVRTDDELGEATLTARGPIDEVALLANALRQSADQAFRDTLASAGTVMDNQEALEFDALVALAEVEPDGPRPKPVVVIHTTPAATRAWSATGRLIAGTVLDRCICNAKVIVRVEDPSTGNVRHQETGTDLPDGIRNAVLDRDRHACTWPGCRRTMGLDVHHLHFRRHGGKHQLWNLTTLYRFHHHRVHDRGFAITGPAPDALSFYRPDGSLLLAAGQSGWTSPPWLDPLQIADHLAQLRHDGAWATGTAFDPEDDVALTRDAARAEALARLRARGLQRTTTRPANPGHATRRPARAPVRTLADLLNPDR